MAQRKRPAKKLERWNVQWVDNVRTWANEMGVDFEGVSDGADLDSRANVMRLKQGGAPAVRQRIYSRLVSMESNGRPPTRTGRVMKGVEEWAKIGRGLAVLDPSYFLGVLDAARAQLQSMEKLHGPSEIEEKSAARPVASATTFAPAPIAQDPSVPVTARRKR